MTDQEKDTETLARILTVLPIIIMFMFFLIYAFPPKEVKRNEFKRELIDDIAAVLVHKSDSDISIILTDKNGRRRTNNRIKTFLVIPSPDGKSLSITVTSER